MGTPSENLNEIAGFSSKISDYTYNAQVSLDFIDSAVTSVMQLMKDGIDGILIGLEHIMDSTERSSKSSDAIVESVRDASSDQLSSLSAIAGTISASTPKQSENNASGKEEENGKEKGKQGQGKFAPFDFKKITSGLTGGFVSATKNAGVEVAKFASTMREIGKLKIEEGLPIMFGLLYDSIAALPGAFMDITKFVSMFVAAFDPGIMAKFALTMADLMAVVGMGLRPIMVSIITILRTFADLLMPVMQEFAGAAAAIGHAIMSMAIPFIVIWANQIRQTIPVLEALAPIIEDVGYVFQLMIMPIQALIAIVALVLLSFAFLYQTVMAGVKLLTLYITIVVDALINFAKWLFWSTEASDSKATDAVAESLAGTFEKMNNIADGAMKVFKNAFAAPEKKPSSGMAAKGASFSGIGDLGKNLMQAAFGSSTENVAKQQLDAQKQGNDILKGIAGMLAGQGGAKMAGVRN